MKAKLIEIKNKKYKQTLLFENGLRIKLRNIHFDRKDLNSKFKFEYDGSFNDSNNETVDVYTLENKESYLNIYVCRNSKYIDESGLLSEINFNRK
jgi:hypothetical protein